MITVTLIHITIILITFKFLTNDFGRKCKPLNLYHKSSGKRKNYSTFKKEKLPDR
jgi:hypothetical protein